MDLKKYGELVEVIISSDFCPPREMIEDYNNPNRRVMAARFLMRLGKYEEAIELMLTLKKDDLEDLEQWIWVQNDLGRCYFWLYEDVEKALEYFRSSEKMAFETDTEYFFIVRGELWKNTLDVLHKAGRMDEVKTEIENKIKYFDQNSGSHRYNSYLFHAYYFLAKHEENIDKALDYLYTAMQSFPLDQGEDKEGFKNLWENRKGNPVETFENIEKLTFHTVVWEF